MNNILLVEDNESIALALELSLKKAGYNITIADTMTKAIALIYDESFALILLDVSLPDGNGFTLFRDYIKQSNTPTIFLTARDDENDIVKGLDMGAIDYITKPFSTRELMARINRTLVLTGRRSVIKAGCISFDVDKMEAARDGEVINLSSLELKILQLLFINHDKAVSRNQVIECIWKATGNDVYDHTVTVYLKRIRQKLGVDIIKTIKGVGYRIDTDKSEN